MGKKIIQQESTSFLRQLLCFITALGFACNISAQDVNIKGVVFNVKDKSPINAASVVIRTLDSTAVAVAVSNERGEFQVTIPNNIDSLLLYIHHINYENYISKVKSSEFGCIYMKPITRELPEIVITGQRPIVRGRDGALLYSASMLLEQSSAQDAYSILSRVPGIMTQGKDLLLIGSPRYSIAINGQIPPISQEQLSKLLQTMSASQIVSVEVFYTAPPQYHVKGAVININTKNSVEQNNHLQGEIYTTLHHHHYPYAKAGVNIDYSKDKLSLSLMYGYDYNKKLLTNSLSSHHSLGESTLNIEQTTKQTVLQHSHLSFIGLGYKIGAGKITAIYSGQYNPFIEKQLDIKGNATGSNHKTEKDAMHSVSIKYMNTNGLQLGASLLTYTYSGRQDFGILSPLGKNVFTSDYGQKIRTYKAFVDNTHTLSSGWQIGYGLSTSYTEDKDFQSFYSSDNIDKPNISETLKEWITSGYLKVGKRFSEQFNIAASLTGEMSEFYSKRDFAVIPKIDATYIINPKNILQFSLSSDKIYPSYWEKRPYVSSIDGYIEGRGNPALEPYNEYTARLTYILCQKYVFSFYHTYQPNYAIQQLYQAQTEPKMIAQTQNWNYNRTTGILSVVPISISKNIRFNYTLNIFTTHARHDHFHEIAFNRIALTAYNGFNANFVLSAIPHLAMDVEAHYVLNPTQGIYNLSSSLGLTAGVKYTFAKERAILTMRYTDIFNRVTPKVNVSYNGQRFDMHSNSDTRGIYFGLTYRFGGYKPDHKEKVDRSRWGHN